MSGSADGRARSAVAHVDAKSGVDGTATDVVGGLARRSEQKDFLFQAQEFKAELHSLDDAGFGHPLRQ